MKQKSYLKLIYKIHTKQLKKAKWDLTLPLEQAMYEYPETIVSIADSQLLRFIDELNGVRDLDGKVRSIKKKIALEKKKPRSRQTKIMIRELYKSLYEILFQPDYICVIMDSEKDYDRANKGFSVNGIKYKRFLGTNGGIKNSTIIYVNEKLYPELKRRLDNGRNMDKELVPAKLEAYQALICSGSTPLPEPKGIIVVKDCITFFKDDVIVINDECDGEPIMTFQNDYDVEHNDSDGYGLMLPEYSRRVREYLLEDTGTISGMNTRYAWTKGMVYTFDFIEFAEKVAGTYLIKDVWGTVRDVRDAEVILTESMLKLWDSYDSWESYYENCQKNHYQFSTPKITADRLESVRNSNYQFLQSYHFTDQELDDLCQPTVDEIKDVLGMDYRRSLLFLCGFGLNDRNVFRETEDPCVRALMADERMINDPYIRRRIWNMIHKKIDSAKKGSIRLAANYAMIAGDPYALCQSMFGLKITGLMKKGELYHKYWIDKGSEELACFRAPMTCHNNIGRMTLCKTEDAAYWYRYIDTAVLLNCWDTVRDKTNGADCDGDTYMCTDNPIIVRNTQYSPTIMCVQRKAEKKVPTEDDIVLANKLAFNDDIGTVTNYITSMIEVQSGFPKETVEFGILDYRIKCGQLYQQNTIDRAKGIISKPMPSYWYNRRDNLIKECDSKEEQKKKNLNMKIVASRKPYFMTYIYPALKKKNNEYISNTNRKAHKCFAQYGITDVHELEEYEPKTEDMKQFLQYHRDVVGNNPCIVNRICWKFENEFDGYLSKKHEQPDFDFRMMKSNVEYSKKNYEDVLKLYDEYRKGMDNYQKKVKNEKIDSFDSIQQKKLFVDSFRAKCEQICSNEKELCDIILDICYQKEKSKQFAWDICGNVIIDNLLEHSGGVIHYPALAEDGEGEFEYCGEMFCMREKRIGDKPDDYTE